MNFIKHNLHIAGLFAVGVLSAVAIAACGGGGGGGGSSNMRIVAPSIAPSTATALPASGEVQTQLANVGDAVTYGFSLDPGDDLVLYVGADYDVAVTVYDERGDAIFSGAVVADGGGFRLPFSLVSAAYADHEPEHITVCTFFEKTCKKAAEIRDAVDRGVQGAKNFYAKITRSGQGADPNLGLDVKRMPEGATAAMPPVPVIKRPDLHVRFSLAEATGTAGEAFVASAVVENRGTGASQETTSRAYMHQQFGRAVAIGDWNFVPALVPGETWRESVFGVLPTQEGTHRIRVCVRDQFRRWDATFDGCDNLIVRVEAAQTPTPPTGNPGGGERCRAEDDAYWAIEEERYRLPDNAPRSRRCSLCRAADAAQKARTACWGWRYEESPCRPYPCDPPPPPSPGGGGAQ